MTALLELDVSSFSFGFGGASNNGWLDIYCEVCSPAEPNPREVYNVGCSLIELLSAQATFRNLIMMLSRKQQLRHLCYRNGGSQAQRHTGHRRLPGELGGHCCNESFPVCPQLDSIGELTGSTREHARRMMNGTSAAHRNPGYSYSERYAAMSCSSHAENGKRSVRFDERIRVVLIPTRSELKTVRDGEEEQGIWWSMQDCLEFRRSVYRRVFALGLKAHPNILHPDVATLLADSDDEDDIQSEVTEINHSILEGNIAKTSAPSPPKLADSRMQGTCQTSSPPLSAPAAEMAA